MRIWEWLKGLFAAKKVDNPYNGWKPSERYIFRYWDGEKDRDEDPMELYIRMQDVGPELDVDLKVARSQLRDNYKGHVKAVEKIRGIFFVKPYKEGGLTNAECLNLLDYFLLWTGFEKKSTSQTQTSAGGTSPSTESTPEEKSPSGSTSDSGCADSDRSTDSPTPTPSGPGSPSGSSPPGKPTSETLPTATEKQSS